LAVTALTSSVRASAAIHATSASDAPQTVSGHAKSELVRQLWRRPESAPITFRALVLFVNHKTIAHQSHGPSLTLTFSQSQVQ
jgi:hypothetical protein